MSKSWLPEGINFIGLLTRLLPEFIRLAHGGGELTFVAPRDVCRGELAIWFLVAIAVAMVTILGAAYLFIRKTLNPLHTLKAGVNEVAAGRLDHRIPEISPSELRDLIRLLIPEFKERQPGVEPGPLVDTPVNADPEKMRIVLRNLLDNALKHTPEDGPAVSISTALRPERLEIVLADQGEGIPAAAQPHLFEPFYRPDVSCSRKTGGYGLGLSLCKAIVDAHGGSIDLVSRLGEGTRVTVTLPRT